MQFHHQIAETLAKIFATLRPGSKPETSSQRRGSIEAEDVRAWLRQLDRTTRSGQTRSAQQRQAVLICSVLGAIANRSTRDPAAVAAALLEGLDRKQLLHEVGHTQGKDAKRLNGHDQGLQRHARRTAITLPEHRLIYFQTPKVASSTIKATLWRLALGDPDARPPEPLHSAGAESPLKGPPDLRFDDLLTWLNQPEFRRFCFVRNPYTRILSCYLHKIQGTTLRPTLETLSLRAALSPSGSADEMSFEAFIDAVGRQAPMEMNPHWRLQTEHLLWDHISFDFVGRIEEINSDLERLGSFLGINLQPYLYVKDRHQTGAKTVVENFYTPRLRERLYEIYEPDFRTFGYSRDLPPSQRAP